MNPLPSRYRQRCAAGFVLLLSIAGLASADDSSTAADATTPQAEAATAPAPQTVDGEPVWFAGDGRLRTEAGQAVALLVAAPEHGLSAEDYDAAGLQRAVAHAEAVGPLNAAAQAALDAALTAAMLHYLHDLHFGRIDPALLHEDFAQTVQPDFDLRLLLHEAVARHQLLAVAAALAPQVPAYDRLRVALAEYRRLAASSSAWQQPLPALPGAGRNQPGKLVPGQTWSGVDRLAERLRALGDLDAAATVAPLFYIEPLVGAMRRFQERHGLPADGVLGKASIAALGVTPSSRVHQIELTLERARWTPLLQAQRMIVINIPEFVLRAYEVGDGGVDVREEMRVIVGKALDTRTPLFDEAMRYIEFSPYWNVPPSIAKAELVPKLRRQPGEWAREGYEFVLADGSVQTALDKAGLDAVLRGGARIRQRPGERNALGDIKFVFPNRDNIYLHHTPSVGLFARERRDFSHGCIRVERPLALAEFVLKNMPEWTEARISEAMTAGKSATLKLDEPIPVLIAYGTALVKQGRIHFFDDIYGHDRLLDEALRQRPRRPADASPASGADTP